MTGAGGAVADTSHQLRRQIAYLILANCIGLPDFTRRNTEDSCPSEPSYPRSGYCVHRLYIFTRATLWVLAIAMCPSVCDTSEFYQNGWRNRAGFWYGRLPPPTRHCVKRKFWCLQKIRVPNSWLRKFRFGISIVETCYQLSSRKVLKKRDKLNRRLIN